MRGALTTALTERLGIEVPVLQAGMALVARPSLVAAVCEAGGLGVLGAAASSPEVLAREIAEVRALTDRPFGVDLVFPPELLRRDPAVAVQLDALRSGSGPGDTAIAHLVSVLEPGRIDALVEACCEARVAAVVAALGSPGPFVDRLHAAGVTVLALCGTPEQARRLEVDGVDAVIASGAEAGGHTGRIGSLTLWQACLDAVDVPVVAAGGIVDGRGLAAALVVGCQAAWVGTRFLATVEGDVHPRAKEVVVGMGVQDTTVTRAFSGKPMRVRTNRFVVEFEASGGRHRGFPLQLLEGDGRSERGLRAGDVDDGAVPVGQAGGRITAVEPAGAVVGAMVRDAARALARWNRAAPGAQV